MGKDEFVAYLAERGYSASVESGVVMIRAKKMPAKKDIEIVQDMMKEAGYNASYGWKGC